jgi:hypothetical protein
MHLFRGLGGYWYLRSGSHSLQHISFQHDAPNWHGFGDRGSLELCSCQHNAHDVRIWGLRLLHGANGIAEAYVPSTTVASGSVASAPWVFFTSCCTGFVSLPGQIGGFPA